MKKIDIISACSDLGIHIDGAKLGPLSIINNIEKNNINKIKIISSNENYIKNLDKNNYKKNLEEINLFNLNLYNEINLSLSEGNMPITLGGDHSIAIASALASINKYKNMGIIWFDAHGDFNTFETTHSGNIHGLPFAAVTNYEKSLLTNFHNGNYFKYNNAVLLGGRDIDKPGELKNLNNAGITIISTEDIKKYGIEPMCKKAFDIASNGTEGIHVSYDLDVIDPSIAPGVSVPANNGLNLTEAYTFLDYIIKNKEKIKSVDLVELNPLKDIHNKTKIIATDILNKLIKEI